VPVFLYVVNQCASITVYCDLLVFFLDAQSYELALI